MHGARVVLNVVTCVPMIAPDSSILGKNMLLQKAASVMRARLRRAWGASWFGITVEWCDTLSDCRTGHV